jgi:hypothetical protein
MDILVDIYRKQTLLSVTALIHAGLAVVMLAGLALDNREILGLNPWIKPLKFALSISIYLATMALFMAMLPQQNTALFRAAVVIAGTMLIEIVLISLQAARGTTSHFNTATAFDAAIFAAMGIAVAINTVAVVYVLWQYIAQPPTVAPAYLWGIRLGLVICIVASPQGFMMASRGAHTVGAADGGPGLPFVNWSTEFGDMRIAHFVGLHALQVVPLVGYLASGGNNPDKCTPISMLWVFGVAGLVAGAMVFAWLQAMAGRPLMSAD